MITASQTNIFYSLPKKMLSIDQRFLLAESVTITLFHHSSILHISIQSSENIIFTTLTCIIFTFILFCRTLNLNHNTPSCVQPVFILHNQAISTDFVTSGPQSTFFIFYRVMFSDHPLSYIPNHD